LKLLDKLFSKGTTDIDVMKAEVAVGDLFKQWLSSDVGKYIVGRAEQYETAILRELRDTDPKETIKIIQLQSDAKMPGKLLQWIEDAIGQGEIAGYQLNELFDEEDR
jgi:hypothetical protein